MVVRTLNVFENCKAIDRIVLVVNPDEVDLASRLVRDHGISKVASITPGGESRQDSVRNGLREIPSETAIVAIHDAARPLVTEEIITSSVEAAGKSGAAIAAVPVIDTVKYSDDGRFVSGTLDRSRLYSVQTPQTFERGLIEEAYERAYADSYIGTDDASLVERLGAPVAIVAGSYENIKVTTPPDVATAEAVLASRGEGDDPGMRIGHGYDVHRFATGRRLFLGGIEFPGEDGLLGHSDADVMIHAIMDALLGAAALPDIGRIFPDTDPAFKDVRSTELLAVVADRIAGAGWRIGNIDATLIAERPRVAKRVPEMQATVARSLRISPSRVGIKASTAEGLGFVGEGLGIECHAVALLYRG